MAIVDCAYTANFTIIGNQLLNDEDLSADALGVLCYLRSKPRDWQVIQTQLARRFKCGRERIARIIKELIGCGYMEKTQARDTATNKFATFDYLVFGRKSTAVPETASQPIDHVPADRKAAPRVSRSTAFPTLLSTDLLPSTDSTKEGNSRHSARAEDASDVDRGEHGGQTSITTGGPLPSSSGRSVAAYRQSKVEAAIAWRELERMEGWGGTFGEDEMSHWHRLLRKGYAADDILDTAEAFLLDNYEAPSLGDWLACFEHDHPRAAAMLAPIHRATGQNHGRIAA
jgi:hypothetical protein